jgi:hypothetical protein
MEPTGALPLSELEEDGRQINPLKIFTESNCAVRSLLATVAVRKEMHCLFPFSPSLTAADERDEVLTQGPWDVVGT